MWCSKCQNELRDCECPDIEERLASLARSPHVALRWCQICNTHADRCNCPKEQANA